MAFSRMKLLIPMFCPAKRQSAGQNLYSPHRTIKKASQVRYNLTRFAGSWRRGYQSCKVLPEIIAYISKILLL